jgi:hypothetical protein
LPGRRPVEERYRTDPLTAYASNLEHMMADVRGPDLWVHGHLHNRPDHAVGSTRVVANPRGYPTKTSYRDFDAAFVAEI